MIDYTIGDDIVCVQTHPEKIIKEGMLFVAIGLRINTCCKLMIVDIGLHTGGSSAMGIQRCNCDVPFNTNTTTRWINATYFKKLDTLVDISELTEVLENTTPFEV